MATREIEERPGSPGPDERMGVWRPLSGPMATTHDRGASRVPRGATSAWGFGGPVGPMATTRDRGASRVPRGATSAWGYGGPDGAPISERSQKMELRGKKV